MTMLKIFREVVYKDQVERYHAFVEIEIQFCRAKQADEAQARRVRWPLGLFRAAAAVPTQTSGSSR
jgi:hypothetical protein